VAFENDYAAIIIGASSGIGKKLAELLANSGVMTGVTGRRSQLLEESVNLYPEKMICASFDVANINESASGLEQLARQLGGLDLLVLCAGTGDLNPSLDFTIEKETIDTNILGFTHIADWAYRYFEQQGHGHLVLITSIAGLRGGRHAPAYNASKAYQINYTEGLRQKAKKAGNKILITDIRPGFVDTAMAKGEGQFWVAPVDKAAAQIFRAIQKKQKRAYITRRWQLIAGILKLLPASIHENM
jgi:short-subunit dehydrogenase